MSKQLQTLQYCVETRAKLHEILGKNTSANIKKLIVRGLKQQLKQMARLSKHRESRKKDDLNTTFFTDNRSTVNRQEQERLINLILAKQSAKIQLDQEIETCEDDLSQIEKTVQSKQQYNQNLGVKIAMIKSQVEREQLEGQLQNKQQSKLQKVKSTPSLFAKIFG